MSMKTDSGGFWFWIGDAICAAVFLIVLHPFCTAVDFGNDAYSYLDLSHHLFDDFYRIHVIRQFEHNTLYSCGSLC